MAPEKPRSFEPPAEQTSPESRFVPVEALTPAQKEQAEYWLRTIASEKQPVAPEQTEQQKALAELETLFDAWLSPEKLAELHAIVTEAEAMASPLRTEAKLALRAILERVKKQEGTPEHAECLRKYRLLSKAVGIINSGLVDHTR